MENVSNDVGGDGEKVSSWEKVPKRQLVEEENVSSEGKVPFKSKVDSTKEFNLQDNVEHSSDKCLDQEVIIENTPNNNLIEFTTDNTNTEEMIDCQEHSANTVSSNEAVLK
ncbi:unnamed protein product [Ceutorhynchus assimilis]|uniref:Uncharacterized protein n=1 Tax=Ceutorhynchus assimilis TaxID=467358 RepID=A0A9N9MCY7_9CUCU|nr:unnamed protein product [Ceutorhynchus assimilis]